MDKPKLWIATHKYAKMAPRKGRPMINLIRGKRCSDALDQLRFNHLRSARMIEAVLKSAMVNADEQEADMSKLIIAEAWIDGGPYTRRWRPKDRGRAHPIAKRTSHIVVKVAEA